MNDLPEYINKQVGFVFDPDYIEHRLEDAHPEAPERLKAVMEMLEKSELTEELKMLPPASIDVMPYIKMIHPDDHICSVEGTAYDESICRKAVAGAIAGVDAVCRDGLRSAFCAVRPPGHHATDEGEAGFCFYNNIAIAARYAQSVYGLNKILIADWDFHHGNGTEWAFYDDSSILFFSTHSKYAFPMTGYSERKGEGTGYGYNINIPLYSEADDNLIIEAFEKTLLPAADRFKPDLVLISAGFDSREEDFLGNFKISDKGFSRLTDIMQDIAATYCQSRLVSILEGGYNPDGLASAVEAHLISLLDYHNS